MSPFSSASPVLGRRPLRVFLLTPIAAALCVPAHAEGPQPAPASTTAPSNLETVIVTASPLTQNADALANIVDSVDQDQILRRGGAGLADALADVPGVSGTSFASGASRPVIRGFDANRVKVLENGIGSFDVSDIGPDHGVPIDPLTAKRIEVVRGAGTLRYGSQAIGGVVNAVNNRVPLELPDAPIAGSVSGAYDSNSDGRSGAAELEGRLGQFALHADGFAHHADDYEIPHGPQDNTFFRGNGAALGSSYFFGENGANRIGGAVVHYNAEYGIPNDTVYIDMRQTKEMLRSSFAVGAGPLETITVDGGYADYEHTENNPDGSVNSTFRNRELDSRSEGLFGRMGPLSRSALGLQYQHRNFSALGEDSSYLFPTTAQTFSAFGFTEAPLHPQLNLQAGLRVEQANVEGTPASDIGSSRHFTPLSASTGLVYTPSEAITWGFTVSSTARAPAVTELYARGAHDGPGTYETGDPSLSIERAQSLEGTFRWRSERWRADAAVWGSHFQNYIYGDLTGRSCDEDGNCVAGSGNELKELFYTQRNASFRGAEGKISTQLYRGAAGNFEALALADYVRATLSEGGGNVPRLPPYHLGGGLNWDRGDFDGGLLLKYTGAQRHPGETETDTAGFTSLDAQLGWSPSESVPGLQLNLVGHNLTNSTQRNAVALNKDDVVLPGRNIRLALRMSF